MKKLNAFIEITRPINLIITFVVVYVSAIICSGNFHLSLEIFLAGVSAVFVAAAGNIVNDYFDIEIDKINRPNRPISSGRVTKKEAVTAFFLLVVMALFISYTISIEAFLIVSTTIALLFIYSFRYKSVPLIGNIIIAVCTALAFIYGGVIVGNVNAAIIPALFAFLINLIREILKDVEDFEGDKQNDLSTFPIKYGLPSTKTVLLVFVFILILATTYPFIFKLYTIEYFLIVLFLVDLPLIYFLNELYSKDFLPNLSKLSLLLKLIMLFGLMAIHAGKI